MTEKFDQYISVSRQFLRSVNLEADFGREDALQGYICQDTAKELVDVMSHHITQSRQRAFTWTGPYGGGKSSLALALCSLVCNNEKLRLSASSLLRIEAASQASEAWQTSKAGWLVLPIVGKRDSVVSAISSALDKIQNTVIKKPKSKDVISRLVLEASSRPNDGVLVVLDELGKFLESAAIQGEDIYFYQELAEAASRSEGKLIIVGILHQAFEQYAMKLGRGARDEWSKIQGRYVDIPLVVKTDEVIELVGRAIERNGISPLNSVINAAKIVAATIAKRRLNAPENLISSLESCWPLHPITASLLGPISRKKFSQNERSIFGFLASGESLGFSLFLKNTAVGENQMYGPDRYWDYLKANFEQAILASSEGHIWALANDSIERTESKSECTRDHVKIAKSIALIDMFRAGSGLAAEESLIQLCANDITPAVIKSVLDDLTRWSIVVFRKHLNAWTIYSGSDFDIDKSIGDARSELGELDVKQLVELAELNPIVAKRHFHETGNLRWLTRSLIHIDGLEDHLQNFNEKPGAAGEFVLVIPSSNLSEKQNLKNIESRSNINLEFPVLLGYASNADKISELGMELSALERIQKTRRELDGDAVARKEVGSRISTIKLELADELKNSFETAIWSRNGKQIPSGNLRTLSTISSELVDETFSKAPRVFNELVNRESLSSNIVKARKDLMYKMLSGAGQPRLGYEGYSADAGLFYSVIENSSVYQGIGNDWKFTTDASNEPSFSELWSSADSLFKKNSDSVTLATLYSIWQAPPIGARKGMLPIFALVYFLANRHQLSLYIENTFIPDLTEAYLDEWMQDTKRVAFKHVEIGRDRKELLQSLSKSLSKKLGKSIASTPLESARGLVTLIANLPNWTKRTMSISADSQELRRLILRANDPFKVLFIDIPVILKVDNEKDLIEKITNLTDELQQAYPLMLERFKTTLYKALDHNGSIEELRSRANKIKGKSGDFKYDSFIAHLSEIKADPSSLEGILSTTMHKNPRDWVDRDQEAAINALGEMCAEFRKIETFVSLRGENSTRNGFAFIYSDPKNATISSTFDVADSKLTEISALSTSLLETLISKGLTKDEILATLANCCTKALEKQ